MSIFSYLIRKIPEGLETRSFPLFYLLCKYRFRYFSEVDIRKYQADRAEQLTRFAVTNSRFFRRHYAGADIEDFRSLPFVNKKIMMDNLTDYNTVELKKQEIMDFCLEVERTRDFSRRLRGFNVGMSSGTSGNKGVEIVTRREESYMRAALFARYDFPKGEKINLAFILRVSAPAFNLNIFGHKLTYISQLGSIAEISGKLSGLQPNVISAPPSMLKLIAREVEKGALHVHPKRLVSYAEILYPDVKSYLERIFGCAVHEIYKCTEGPIAISCKHGRLHINEDLVLVETLDDDGSPTPPGRPCKKMIVTDLHKRSQPIIRYALNDVITISPEKCPCGSSFRVIESIQGRADDLFWAKKADTGEWQYIFPDYISRAINTSSESIEEYQIIQNSPTEVLVRLQLREDAADKQFEKGVVVKSVQGVFLSYGCAAPVVDVVFEKPAFNKNSGKLIRIHRNFEVE